MHRPRKATWAGKSVTKTEIGIKNTDPIVAPPAPGAQKQNQTPPANLPHRYEGGPSSDQRCLPIILWAREHLGRVSGPRPQSLVSHPGRDQAPGLTGGAGRTLARRGKAALSPNRAHTAGGSNAGSEVTRLGLRVRPRSRREDRQDPAAGEAGEAAGPRPQQAAEWPYAASRPRLRAKPQRAGLSLPGRVPAAPSSWRLRPTFCSASGPPRSGSGPASPGSFKLTSDRYRGWGRPSDCRVPPSGTRKYPKWGDPRGSWTEKTEGGRKRPRPVGGGGDRCRKLSRFPGDYRIRSRA